MGWVFCIGFGNGPQAKTALGLATVLSANLAFKSRGNPAQSFESCLSFSVLVPGAIRLAGTQYQE
jgi:hypothetical protein